MRPETRRPILPRVLVLIAFVWAVRNARAADPEPRTAAVGDEIRVDSTTVHTFTAPGTFRLFVPGVDIEYRVYPATQPTPPEPVPPDADAIRLTVAMRTPIFLKAEGLDAKWDMPALPDTPARSYFGPFFGWSFDKQGVYNVVVTPGRDYVVTVTDPLPVTVLKLPPGRQSIRRTLTSPTWVVAQDVDNPPVINGGFTVETPNCYFGTLIFDGDTEVNRSAIKIGKGGSAYIDDIEFRSIGNGIHSEVPTMLGVVARHVRSGSGVRKYPFAMFSGHTFALYDFAFADYRGIEHAIRIDHNGGVAPHDGLIAYGSASRVTDVKECTTFRRMERISMHHVSIDGGYAALRLFYHRNDYASGQSRDVYVRWCTMSDPIHAYWSGCRNLMLEGNTFTNMGATEAPIQYETGPGHGFNGVREMRNTRNGAGPMHSGESAIPNYVYVP